MNIAVQTQETRISVNDEVKAEKTIAFTFNPDEVEMVRAKDGAYIIRQKRPRGEVVSILES